MNHTNKLRIYILLAVLPVTAFSQINKSKSTPLPLDPAVRTRKLTNGFTYYIRLNQEPKNRVLMYMINKAGSVLDDEDQRV